MKCVYCGDELELIPDSLGRGFQASYRFCKEGRLTVVTKASLMVDRILVFDLNIVKVNEETSFEEIVEMGNQALEIKIS